MAIDIGAGAEDRGSYWGTTLYTLVDRNNPANASGTITSVEIWALTEVTGCIVGTFYLVEGTTYKCRDSAVIGTVPSGSKQTFTEDSESDPLAITVETGDYIGVYFTGGNLERDDFPTGNGGAGFGFVEGQYIDPNDEATYNFVFADDALSLYGIGEEAEEGVTVTPETATLSTTGYASILKELLTPSTLALITTGFVPILKELLTPATLGLSTSAYIPVITISGNILVTPGILALILAGYIPVIIIPTIHRNVADDFWDWDYEPPVKVTITPLPDEIQFKEKE